MALSATCLWATVADLKPWLSFASTDVQHDALLERLAGSVTEELEKRTDRIYVSRSITETLDGKGSSELWLRGYPVTAISTFTVDGVAVDAADYVLVAEAGILKRKTGVWATGVGNYAITYVAGYARASLPDLVVTLGAKLLKLRYRSWSADTDVFNAVQFGGGQSIQPFSDWASIKDELDLLRYEFRVGGVA